MCKELTVCVMGRKGLIIIIIVITILINVIIMIIITIVIIIVLIAEISVNIYSLSWKNVCFEKADPAWSGCHHRIDDGLQLLGCGHHGWKF